MIFQPRRLSKQEIDVSIVKSVKYLQRKYWRMDESDDCENLLRERLQKILNSPGFLNSDYPTAYLRKCLLNLGVRFYQTRLRQIENEITNQDIGELSREHGVYRNHENRYQANNLTLALDVAAFFSKLSSEERILCNGLMAGDTCRSIASQLGISHEAANKKRKKFLSSAKHDFRSYQ